jgi:hypothetical protein
MRRDEWAAENVPISSEVFDYLSRCTIPLRQEVRYAALESSHPMFEAMQRQLRAVDAAVAAEMSEDERFERELFVHRKEDLEFEARAWVITEALSWEIPKRRLELLEPIDGETLPRPLRHPALEGLTPDSDHLVPLNEFEWNGSRLVRNDFAFLPLSPVESPNSQYWFLNELFKLGRSAQAFVRLDPFLNGLTREFPMMAYRMMVYGRPLDWLRIRNLEEEEHGQWRPDREMQGIEVTDFAWTPRGGEVHFRCEEIPIQDATRLRGSRYLHAVYIPSRDEFIHLDAAVRVFTAGEWQQRMKTRHVRKAGKVGRRHKVFRIDSPLSTDAFSNLCAQFFVWNSDVGRYFGADTSS